MSLPASTARSLLFVPGDRPERFDKAVATGADSVILDLEDAVAPEAKTEALGQVLTWLESGGVAAVRINAVGTAWHDTEVEALRGTGAPIVVPKTESAEDLAELSSRLGGQARIIALVETAKGVHAADTVSSAVGVIRLALGNVDLSTELGVDPASFTALAYARGRLVIASACAGLPAPIDGVTTALDASATLAADLAHARELGFGGKLCIHPRQVEQVNHSFSPTEDELAWAARVLTASDSTDGVRVVDGKMIDPPVVRRAQRLVARAATHTR